MNKKEFYYRARIEVEILVNREQEYIRNKNRECDSEFDDCDFYDAKRWIRDKTISFSEKTFEKAIERTRFEFHNCRIDIEPMIEDGYFYYFDNNCLVNHERLLHRAKVYIDYSCDVELSEEDLKSIAVKETIEDNPKKENSEDDWEI